MLNKWRLLELNKTTTKQIFQILSGELDFQTIDQKIFMIKKTNLLDLFLYKEVQRIGSFDIMFTYKGDLSPGILYH